MKHETPMDHTPDSRDGAVTYGGGLMRRLSIFLVFALMPVLLVLAPAAASKPNCDVDPSHASCKTDDTPPTTVPEPEVCEFNSNGVLENWDGSERLQCQWTVSETERPMTFKFTLSAATGNGETVHTPHLIVTDVYPNGGQICFNDWGAGWSPLDYSWSSFTLPEDGVRCDGGGGYAVDADDVFAITIDVINVKKGTTLELTYTTS